MVGWVDDFVNKEFSSNGVMLDDGQEWCKSSRKWMTKFLKGLGAVDIKFSKGHYGWSMFARVGEQWWYFSSGDVRYKIVMALLVRKCDGPKDYRGKVNRHINYDQGFENNLRQELSYG